MISLSGSIRDFLICEVRRFVEQARHIRGVHRIALIGSLATTKAHPKDVDLLVLIDDDADLARLAAAGRQLKGRAQSRNSGADIFLADADGRYLGRMCHWRDCTPGVRMSCRALHCGRRQFLCDDLEVLTLAPAVVDAPSLDLWPAIRCRRPVPKDVAALVAALTVEETSS